MLDQNTRTPAWKCETCGYQMDTVSGVHSVKPSPGHISLCMKCGELYIFTENLTGRKPTLVELIDIQTSHAWPDIERVRWAIRKLHEKIAAGELEPFSE